MLSASVLNMDGSIRSTAPRPLDNFTPPHRELAKRKVSKLTKNFTILFSLGLRQKKYFVCTANKPPRIYSIEKVSCFTSSTEDIV